MPGLEPAPLPPLEQPNCPRGHGAAPDHDSAHGEEYAWANGQWSSYATSTPNYQDRQNQLGRDTPPGIDPYAAKWDANRCGLAQLGIEYRKSRVFCTNITRCNSDPATTPDHPGIERAQLASLHPVRATDPRLGYSDPTEPCMQHRVYSEIVNGRRRAVGCSGEDVASSEWIAEGASWGLLSVRATQDLVDDRLGRAGRARVLWPYRLPRSRSLLVTSPNCWMFEANTCFCGVPA